ncbi:hypothetical protein EDD18DRAFT_1109314 [Armillaria luteobubalina]|uniref:Uncharacterized protein n=1 Tax=Armillaria luteobubalina TaxID=153913 RepID=A0AA39PYD5_9AGAR|nr:hypothetical protein EDD18DRAFT_1109314 [Armillaria luteobubalina]
MKIQQDKALLSPSKQPVPEDLPHSQAAEPTSTNEDFLNLIDHWPWVYAEKVYRKFMATVTNKFPQGDNSRLCDELTKLATLIQDVTKYSDKILNNVGVGKDLAEAQEVQDCMQEVEHWLEDILCGALEGVDVLHESHQSHCLMYQTCSSL